MKSLKIIIAGGSTGGHIFPSIALADEFTKINPKTKILFIGSQTTLENNIFKKTNYTNISINLKANNRKKTLFQTILQVVSSILKAKIILKTFMPQIVISVGGYSAGPVAIVAKINKIPVIACEQNILPGLTNKLIFKFADNIYTSFRDTIGLKGNNKTILSGNPLRQKIIDTSNLCKFNKSNKTKKITIFVTGGSQGANSINVSIINALQYIKNVTNIYFIHQAGLKDKLKTKQKYISLKINATVKDFFYDIASCYEKADIVICRAGATTISELTAIGRCSIIIPYPFATKNHQLLNAQVLSKLGGTKIILEQNLNGITLAKNINKLVSNPKKISLMAKKAKLIGLKNASKLITADVYKLLKQKRCI